MKISVDNDRCEGHGLCNAVDAELFPVDGEGYSVVGKDRDVPAGKEDTAREGVDACPMAALSISED